ncbi:MAG: ABC transporter permease, partial [Candidatus Omnitrophica bacterium]|nr:ABC transporter permease [Candidatus Omnitrophota bacterium]
MNLTRVKAIAQKEFIHIFRDPRSLGMAIVIPMLLLVLFGYALTLDVDNVPFVIWDQDKTQISQDYILNFKNSPYFKIVGYFDGYQELQSAIDKNQALMAMVIPDDFSKRIESNQSAPVQLLVDGSDSNTSTIAIGYVTAVTSKYNKNFIVNELAQAGIKDVTPIDMRSRV